MTTITEPEFLARVQESDALHAEFRAWWERNHDLILLLYPGPVQEWQVELECWKQWKMGRLP